MEAVRITNEVRLDKFYLFSKNGKWLNKKVLIKNRKLVSACLMT